jgi:hypothetical protein
MSGETLRAPRRQLRRLRASAFDRHSVFKSATIARLSGARRIFGFSGDSFRAKEILLLSPKNCHVIRKNIFLVEGSLACLFIACRKINRRKYLSYLWSPI